MESEFSNKHQLEDICISPENGRAKKRRISEDSSQVNIGATANSSTDMDRESLMSLEKMDRSSPDLWPEQLPGIYDFASLVSSPYTRPSTPSLVLSSKDQSLLYQFGALTPDELIEEVRKLQNVAYQLGVEEAKQMTRGKYLHVLANPRHHHNNNSWVDR